MHVARQLSMEIESADLVGGIAYTPLQLAILQTCSDAGKNMHLRVMTEYPRSVVPGEAMCELWEVIRDVGGSNATIDLLFEANRDAVRVPTHDPVSREVFESLRCRAVETPFRLGVRVVENRHRDLMEDLEGKGGVVRRRVMAEHGWKEALVPFI
jgi:hypothetical protein